VIYAIILFIESGELRIYKYHILKIPLEKSIDIIKSYLIRLKDIVIFEEGDYDEDGDNDDITITMMMTMIMMTIEENKKQRMIMAMTKNKNHSFKLKILQKKFKKRNVKRKD
jgi:hypothetical protein